MPSYVSKHPKGSCRYQKAIPKDLQALFRTRKGKPSSHCIAYIVSPPDVRLRRKPLSVMTG